MNSNSATRAMVNDMLWRANETIGVDVVGDNGKNMGSVEDVVLDRSASRIAYLIVSYGGLFGIGEKHFAVPWQAFGQTADRELSLGIDPEELKNAPGFEKGTLPITADPLFHKEVHSFYNTKPYSLDQQEQDDDQAFDWDSWANRRNDTTWARRLDDLTGMKIENAQGKSIAKLDDVIVDSREGRAVYAVVCSGGVMGFSKDRTIIPWNALRLDVAHEVYVTGITLDQLKQSKLSDTEYRNLENREYSRALYSTFGTQPFWEEFSYETETN